MSPRIQARDAEWLLAQRLYEKMEHLDPSEPGEMVDWKNLDDEKRQFYWACIRAIFSERELCRAAVQG